MAQTITLRAQGMADRREARLSSPLSLRDSRYFISPAWPAAIQAGKCSSSGKSRTGAIPASSNPASWAEVFTSSESEGMGLNHQCRARLRLRDGRYTSLEAVMQDTARGVGRRHPVFG